MFPSDPWKAVVFLLLILPGFVALGLIQLWSDLRFDEFLYTMLALSLSLLIFVVSLGLLGLLLLFLPRRERRTSPADMPWRAAFDRRRSGSADPDLSSLPIVSDAGRFWYLFTPIVLVATVGAAVSGWLLYRNEVLMAAPQYVFRSLGMNYGLDAMATPSELLFRYYRNTSTAKGFVADARPAHLRGDRMWVRVFLRDQLVYEGFPRYVATRQRSPEFFLSPVCRVRDGGTTVTPVDGPGLVLFADQVGHVELLDERTSRCCQAFFSAPPYSCGATDTGRPAATTSGVRPAGY